MKISIFENAKMPHPKGSLVFDQYLENIKQGYWQDWVLKARALRAKSPEEYKRYKTNVPAITASGEFKYRRKNDLLKHSGILAIDIDAQDNPDGIPKDELAADIYTYAMHSSLSGAGLVVYVKIDPNKHLEAFEGIEKHYADSYHVIIDTACKNVDRLRFVSFDPDLHKNAKAKTFRAYLKKANTKPRNYVHVSTTNDFEHCVRQLVSQNIDITYSYHDWVNVAFAIAKEFGENGRSYFHEISAISPKYNQRDTDRKYDNALATGRSVGIATFYYLCKMAGVETKTQRTEKIEAVARMQRKLVGKNGGHKDTATAMKSTKKILSKIEGIEGDDVEKIGEQVMQMPAAQLEAGTTKDLVEGVRQFLRGYDLRFNEVTRTVELDGKDLTDRDLNTIYINALEVLSTGKRSVSKDMLFSMIDSDNTPSYNPFKDFFERNKDRATTGHILELVECFTLGDYADPVAARLEAKTYIEKWLLSVVASMHGTYSIMCLVLCGSQNTGKTTFFRNLLPTELSKYYAESKLDDGKDSEILMCKKLIVCDDEFAGKSKQDAKKFKDLISKQTFSIRKPYGRISEDLNRYAVLCGASNEPEVLNDPTGNRRVLPVNITAFDAEKYKKIDKVGLWMEIYNYWRSTGDYWMLNKEDIASLSKFTVKNEQPSQEEEAFLMLYKSPESGKQTRLLTNTQIRAEIENNTRLKISAHKLGLALTKLGFEKKLKRINGKTMRVYEVCNVTDF